MAAKSIEGRTAPKGAGGIVWVIFHKRENCPAVQMTERMAASFERKGHVKIVGDNKYKAMEQSETMAAQAKAEGVKEADGIENLALSL